MKVNHPALGYKTVKLSSLRLGDAYLSDWIPERIQQGKSKLLIVTELSAFLGGGETPPRGMVCVFDPETGYTSYTASDQQVTPVEIAPLTYKLLAPRE